MTCAPVFETLRSFVTVLPWSSKTMISTSTTGGGRGFLLSFFGGLTTCLGPVLIDTAGSLGASGRRTDVGLSAGLCVTFFLVVDFFLIADETAFGLMGEGSDDVF